MCERPNSEEVPQRDSASGGNRATPVFCANLIAEKDQRRSLKLEVERIIRKHTIVVKRIYNATTEKKYQKKCENHGDGTGRGTGPHSLLPANIVEEDTQK